MSGHPYLTGILVWRSFIICVLNIFSYDFFCYLHFLRYESSVYILCSIVCWIPGIFFLPIFDDWDFI